MAKKRNVDAYGKSWSPIDIPNLEKAVKLYERLNYLQDHFAGSLSGSSKIWSQINEKAEIETELQKLGVKLTEEQAKNVLELFKVRERENRLSGFGNIPGGASGTIQRAQSITNNNGQTLSMNNAGSFIANVAQQRYAQKQLNNNIQYFQDIAKQMGRDPNSRLTSKLAENKTVNQLTESAGKFNFAADMIQVAANTFSKAVNVFSGLFFGGLNRQANTYEDTFTNISVRTGINKQRYFSEQTGMASRLYSSGLAGNIANSEVQQMWNKLAETGMGQEKMFANALETVLTQKIVPYLDASDKYFQQLYNENPNLMKQIRGIGRATNELEGSSEVVTEHLQDLIKDVSPIATLANQELGVQLAKSTGMYQNLRKQGMTDYEIRQYMGSTYQVYTDPLAALKSGNLDQALAVVGMMSDNADMDDFGVNTEYLLRNSNWVSNLIPEYANGQSKILSGILPSSVDNITRHRANMKNYDINAAAAAGNAIAADLDLFGERATNDYINDVNNTLKQMQANELENASTWLARIYEQIGYWGDVLAVLLKGIAGVVGAKILGGIGKKILGIGGGAGFLSSGIGYNLMGSGAALGINSPALAAAAGGAGVLGGGAMAVKGGIDVYNDISTGNTSWKTGASAVGAVGGAVGAGLLLASNPVGWAVLAAGGIALAVRAIGDYVDYVQKSTDATEELAAATEAEVRLKQDTDKKEETILEQYQERIRQTTDIETAKRLAIEAGIATEEDLRDSKYDEIDAVRELVDTYIKEKKKLNEDTTQYLKDIRGVNDEQQKEFIAEFLKKYGEDMDYKDLGEKDYKALNAYGLEMQSYAQSLIDSGEISANGETSNDAYKHIAWMVKKGLLDHNYYDDNFTEGDYRILFREGTNADRRVVGKQMLLANNGEYYNNVLLDSSVRDVLGNKYQANFTLGNENAIASTLGELFIAAESGDKAAVESHLSTLRYLGLNSSEGLMEPTKSKLKTALDGLGLSFRSGLSYVPYDDYLANLHQGEAVITAATASELRGLIGEYRKSHNMSVSLDTAIQNQTATLVNKMDEIIQVMQNDNLFTSSSDSSSRVKNLFNNMKYMRSSKSFNQ